MLTFITWLWGDEKFTVDHVRKLRAGIARHVEQEHRFICFADRTLEIIGVETKRIPDPRLCLIPGCFARLRVFDPWFQAMLWPETSPTDRVVSLDLDTIITGPLDDLFPVGKSFMILQGGNVANPNPYCGAVMQVARGAHCSIWSDFSVEAAENIEKWDFADDQGWIWHKLGNNAPGWKTGASSGIYVFQKPGWPRDPLALPYGAKIVTFGGWRKPEAFKYLPWIQHYWRT
jgi:hypothetical protein